MKILLAGIFEGEGGIQTHLKWLARSLEEEGIDVLALCLGSRSSTTNLQESQKIDDSNIEIIHCNSSQWQRTIQITNIIKRFSPDVYLATGTGWNLFIPPIISGIKTRLVFYEVMSSDPNGWRDSRWIVRWFYDEALGQSPIIARHFADCFNWQKKTSVIPAMLEPLELSTHLPKAITKKIELGTAKAALFSRLVPHKQAFWLVQQWELLKDLLGELHIHGSGPEQAPIEEYIRSHGIGDRVKCFGRYPVGQEYVDLLSSYDLTLLPTIGAEGVPLVLLESMACGVPFVAFGVGGIPDCGVDNPNVIVVNPGSDLFIATVRQVLLKLSEGEIDQSQLQQYYFKHYSYSVLKEAWLSYLS
jgi:glycosyltransferase involved in cell wall biosynthesis